MELKFKKDLRSELKYDCFREYEINEVIFVDFQFYLDVSGIDITIETTYPGEDPGAWAVCAKYLNAGPVILALYASKDEADEAYGRRFTKYPALHTIPAIFRQDAEDGINEVDIHEANLFFVNVNNTGLAQYCEDHNMVYEGGYESFIDEDDGRNHVVVFAHIKDTFVKTREHIKVEMRKAIERDIKYYQNLVDEDYRRLENIDEIVANLPSMPDDVRIYHVGDDQVLFTVDYNKVRRGELEQYMSEQKVTQTYSMGEEKIRTNYDNPIVQWTSRTKDLDTRIQIAFSDKSDKATCKRVQIGEEIVKKPIYEWVCEGGIAEQEAKNAANKNQS